MSSVSDFRQMLTGDYRLISINILYYLPDHTSLVNEFFWQTIDLTPKYPRVHRFLDYWHREIDAIIKDIQVSESGHLQHSKWRNGVIYPFRGI